MNGNRLRYFSSSPFLSYCKNELKHFDKTLVQFIPREANMVVDCLAKEGLGQRSTLAFASSFKESLLHHINKVFNDVEGETCIFNSEPNVS